MNVYSNRCFYEILYAMYESCVNLFINTFIDLYWIWEKIWISAKSTVYSVALGYIDLYIYYGAVMQSVNFLQIQIHL